MDTHAQGTAAPIGPIALLLLLQLAAALPAPAAAQHHAQTAEARIPWSPPAGGNGVDATVNVRIRYDVYFQEPRRQAVADITKGNTIYYDGQRLSRQQVGDRAWEAIDFGPLDIAADIYSGNTRVSTVTFRTVTSIDMPGSPDWDAVFPGVSADRARQLFENGFSIRNIRITKLSANGMGRVGAAVRERQKEQEYERAVETGDQLFESGRIQDARAAYARAMQIRNDRSYPRSQIQRIDEQLAAARRAEAAKAAASEKASNPGSATSSSGSNGSSPSSASASGAAEPSAAETAAARWAEERRAREAEQSRRRVEAERRRRAEAERRRLAEENQRKVGTLLGSSLGSGGLAGMYLMDDVLGITAGFVSRTSAMPYVGFSMVLDLRGYDEIPDDEDSIHYGVTYGVMGYLWNTFVYQAGINQAAPGSGIYLSGGFQFDM